jgi:hypothetical protein
MLRRSIRILFRMSRAVSFLFFLAIMGLWARSYRLADGFETHATRINFTSSHGLLSVESSGPLPPFSSFNGRGYSTFPAAEIRPRHPIPGEQGVRSHFDFAGISWFQTDCGDLPYRKMPDGSIEQMTMFPAWQATAPYWLFAALFAVLPLTWLFRHRRNMPGHCPRCNYDLRATPNRCPECGHVPISTSAHSQ